LSTTNDRRGDAAAALLSAQARLWRAVAELDGISARSRQIVDCSRQLLRDTDHQVPSPPEGRGPSAAPAQALADRKLPG
jgi:hypothetical protein